jgi:hypothetical protein
MQDQYNLQRWVVQLVGLRVHALVVLAYLISGEGGHVCSHWRSLKA